MRQPTYTAGHTFLDIKRTTTSADYVIAGVPFDVSVSNRPGTRFGPNAIRQASRMLIDGDHPYHWVNPKTLNISDIGNFEISHGDIEQTLRSIEQQAWGLAHLITLGGDHSISLALLRALRVQHDRPLSLIHFDAHVDFWPDSFGLQYSHGSVFYHAINEGLIDPKRTVQVGIRSAVEKSVMDWGVSRGITILTPTQIHSTSSVSIIDIILNKVGDNPTYLSLDIDVLDPAYAPGTGTPEIGGLTSFQVQSIIRHLRVPFVGADFVEVSPPYDHSEITALAAATMVWEYLCLLV